MTNSELIKKIQSTTIDRLEPIGKIKSFEMLHILRFDSSEVAAIIRLEAKDESMKVEELLKFDSKGYSKLNIRLLEEEDGAYIYFIKGKLAQPSRKHLPEEEMYPCCPLRSGMEKSEPHFVGENDQIKRFLENKPFNYKVSFADRRQIPA